MDNLTVRTNEMISINKTITKYTEEHIRPSLSDIYAFDIILSIVKDATDNPEDCEYILKSDIYAIWGEVLQSDTAFSLEYGPAQVQDEIMEWLQETGHLVFKDDLEEVEDEDESD